VLLCENMQDLGASLPEDGLKPRIQRTPKGRAILPKKKRVLILCTGNSARSQMAEGLLRHDAGGRFEVFSAGTKPTKVRSEAISVMRELGIDISGHRSKSVDEFTGEPFDYILTVCDNAREGCPIFPGKTRVMHQSFEDPAAVEGSAEARLAAFRRIRDELRGFLRAFSAQVCGCS